MVHDCADRSCYWAKAQGDTAVAGTGWNVVRRMTKSVKNRRKTRNAKTYRKFEMSNFKPIRTEADYSAALARIAELMDSVPDSPESEELDALADLARDVRRAAHANGLSEPHRRNRVSHGPSRAQPA